MARYRKRPVEVEAMQWFRNGDHPDDRLGEILEDPMTGGTYTRLEGAVVRLFRHPDIPGGQPCKYCGQTMHVHGWIDTLEGGHVVCPGDWVITGVRGERYPIKADIFDATYEPVAPEPEAHVIDLGDEFGGLTVTLQAVDDVGHWQAIVHDGDKALFSHVFLAHFFNGEVTFDGPAPEYRGVSLHAAMCEAVRVHHDRSTS